MGISKLVFATTLLVTISLPYFVSGQNDGSSSSSSSSTEEYFGLLLGRFNVYHHAISGSLYAVNATTLLIKNFYYDGMGKDAYFWGGSGGNGPGPNGFIIPDQWGRTNVLKKSDNRDFTLTLPEKKVISELKWISVYDLSRLENFGDVYIPDNFEPPGIVTLPPFTTPASDDISDCSSDNIELIDMKTIRIGRLSIISYHNQENYFAVGKGLVPSLRSGAGWRIPDENGYLEPLRSYNAEDITLTLPGDLTLSDSNVHWLAVYDKMADKALCYVNIPSTSGNAGAYSDGGAGGGAIPPSLRRTFKYDYSLPNCVPLHNDFHLAWDVVGQTITFEMVAVANDDDWLGFGLSGSDNKTQMMSSDIAIGHINVKTGQGVVQDYNVDAKAPCTSILEKKRGVCLDSELGHSDSIQVLEGRRIGPLIVIKYRRQLKRADEADKDIDPDKPIPIIWALGRLLATGQPGFHRLYPRKHVTRIQFMPTRPKSSSPHQSSSSSSTSSEEDSSSSSFSDMTCQPFLIPDRTSSSALKPWGAAKIVDGKLRTFSARLGPSAGLRGYEGMTGVANPGYAWYIQGYLAPELYMQRGVTYSFKAIGGQNALSSPRSNSILSGVETTRRGLSRPTAAGRLCLWSHEEKGRNNFKSSDRRLDESYPTFEKFRNSLKLRCENSSEPSIVEVTPNSSWPDVVYYHSFTQPGMGWRIHVLDGAIVGAAVAEAEGESNSGEKVASVFYLVTGMVVMTMTSLFCCR
ncbi:Protein Skeletor, isoforms B/C [Folsomia candida]|uniref:Protein Skeletor, isoforms B/C n=1 Tax=Folsomia candida TaxID=158441 RepID=A0A226E2R2_FOLCA|nr:Protein Skeletor, isoforms B/C [Folsomia candida]